MGLFEAVEPDVFRLKARGNVKGLIKALKYPKSPLVRKGAATALGDLGDERAVEPLIEALKDEDNFVRKMAATACGKIHDRRMVEPLIETLTDDDPFVRERAAESLGKIGDGRAMEPLKHLVEVLDCERFRRTAQEALEEIARKQKLLRF
jgi:HEAT repeat protein